MCYTYRDTGISLRQSVSVEVPTLRCLVIAALDPGSIDSSRFTGFFTVPKLPSGAKKRSGQTLNIYDSFVILQENVQTVVDNCC